MARDTARPTAVDVELPAVRGSLEGPGWRAERPAWTEASWWDSTLHDGVRQLLRLEPGPSLITSLTALPAGGSCPVDHRDERMMPDLPTPGRAPGWPCACQVVVASAWDACATWPATRCASSLVDAAGPVAVRHDAGSGRRPIEDPAREELAHALRSSIPSMANRIGTARELNTHPALVDLVASAAISAWAGRLVLDHVRDLEPDQADQVVCDVARRVHERLASGRRPYHSADVNRLARAARLRICPETEQTARVRAFAGRRVLVQPAGNGMATLIADLSDVDAHRIHRRLTAIAAGLHADAARAGESETRTRDQLRADVLADLLLATDAAVGSKAPEPCAAGTAATDSGTSDTGAPSAGAPSNGAPSTGAPGAATCTHVAGQEGPPGGSSTVPSAEIQVIVTLGTLLGLADDPAEVPGLGPVPAEVARTIAADGRWRAWITDAAGTVTATSTRTYVPSEALARLVRARERTCRFPGCRQPAARCDLDHAVPWPAGPTSAANLGPLCRRHHNFKTEALWRLEVSARSALSHAPARPGTDHSGSGWRWRSPAGLTVDDGPDSALRWHDDDAERGVAGDGARDPAHSDAA